MAQNIVLSWLGGGRTFELKTIQILDELDIERPCIDMENVGYNIEWSQELTLDESLVEYAKSALLLAVVASLAAAFAMFFMASVDAVYMIGHLLHYASPELTTEARVALRAETVTHVVEIVDGYLLATGLLIFALGLYELFISKIDQAEASESANNVLMISSLDDLKNRLAKVVMMILVVRYFEVALGEVNLGHVDILLRGFFETAQSFQHVGAFFERDRVIRGELVPARVDFQGVFQAARSSRCSPDPHRW